ncbi:MAG: hypothetical protein IPN14_08595 [Bacteroidetes bacterium]|nr:hypothetical protein [Bacteroidota bacterium]
MIQKKLESDPKKINQFSSYIRNNLQLLVTEVPKNTDLNKLFEVINNRGLQLRQDEILKARILNHIKRSRTKYAKIWNACSEMDRYIERGLRKEIGSNISSAYDKGSNTFHVPDLFKLIDLSDDQVRTEALDMLSILNKKSKDSNDSNEDNLSEIEDEGLSPDYETTGENEPVKSILTFPQLLLHTLRIYLYDSERGDIQKIDEKELLKTFEKHIVFDESNSTAFIRMLLDVRLCFDSYVIKWVEVAENEKIHMLKKMVLRYSYFRREKPEANDELSLLQSMLYHSQQKQHSIG